MSKYKIGNCVGIFSVSGKIRYVLESYMITEVGLFSITCRSIKFNDKRIHKFSKWFNYLEPLSTIHAVSLTARENYNDWCGFRLNITLDDFYALCHKFLDWEYSDNFENILKEYDAKFPQE